MASSRATISARRERIARCVLFLAEEGQVGKSGEDWVLDRFGFLDERECGPAGGGATLGSGMEDAAGLGACGLFGRPDQAALLQLRQ